MAVQCDQSVTCIRVSCSFVQFYCMYISNFKSGLKALHGKLFICSNVLCPYRATNFGFCLYSVYKQNVPSSVAETSGSSYLVTSVQLLTRVLPKGVNRIL